MDIYTILTSAVQQGASDIFIIAGLLVSFKVNGTIHHIGEAPLTSEQSAELISGIYAYAQNRDIHYLTEKGDDDFSFALQGISRFRVCTYKQRGSLAAVIRVITFALPDPVSLGLPNSVMELTHRAKGLILVTGPAGSGKSTTLACMIDEINRERNSHIITLEDPLEYLHNHKQSIVSQREINSDTDSFVTALRAALRQSPDIILLGEMRDYETITIAMTAAETGHLILSSLHTIGAANTIDRIVDAFPHNQQHQIAVQLSMVLQAVISQQLVPTVDGRRVLALEIMTVTPAIRNMIREGKVHQIDSILGLNADEYMMSMDSSLERLYLQGVITAETALDHSTNPEQLARKLRL